LRYFPDQVLPNLIQLSLHPEIRNLISLDLSYSSLPERWITAILDSPLLIQIKEFKLINCWLTDYTGLALANSPYLQELAVLDLRGNLFSRAIEHVLRDRFAGVLLLMENP
jgi:Ran GTPase-activating protein (RanGAP) involved in mRNA processing and transport